LTDEHGVKIMGFAMDRMIGWSTSDATLDTLPHEYAHIYVKMLRNDPIIKKGIEMWETEEQLVQAIGEYYANRMSSPASYNRMKKWLQHLVKKLKKFFGRLNLKNKEEVKNFIAEEFFRGRFLSDEVVVGDTFFETQLDMFDESNNVEVNEDEVGGNDGQLGDETSKALKQHATDLLLVKNYSKALGIYIDKSKVPELIAIAKRHDNLENYIRELFEWAGNHDPDFAHSVATLTAARKRDLANDFTKLRRRIPGWIKGNKNKQGPDHRIYQEYILNTENAGVSTRGATDKINGRKFPEHYTMNFIEMDKMEGVHDTRLIRLPVKQIMKTWKNKKGEEFSVGASKDLTIDELIKIQNMHRDSYATAIKETLQKLRLQANARIETGDDAELVRQWLNSELMKLGTENLAGHSLVSVIGAKPGDNSAIISTVAREHPLAMNKEKFLSIIDDAFRNNLINQSHYDIMMNESNIFDDEFSNNEIINKGWSRYVLEKIKETETTNLTPKQLLKDLEGQIDDLVLANTPMAQSLANLRFWQTVRTPDYFMYEKGVTDSMGRLSIDMAEGPNPIGMENILGRKGRVMIVDSEDTWIRNDKLPGARIQYKKVDGSTFTGSGIMKAMSNALGYGNRLSQLKTFVRQRDVNDDGSVDYLGMKHMMFSAYDGMVIEDVDGVLIAKLVTKEKFIDGSAKQLTFWEDANGNEFDMIASDNEAKMTFGKYSSIEQKTKAFGDGEYENGYNTIHDIDEGSIAITQVADRSKFSASHPIALGELLLASGSTESEVEKLLNTIQGRYVDVVNHYTDTINSFYENPSLLKAFATKAKQDGEVPAELEVYIDLIDESGMGMFHDVIITHLLPVLNSKIIRNGIYKARSWERNSTSLYLKHATNLGIEEMDAEREEKGVFVSADNFMAMMYLEKGMAEYMGVPLNRRGRISNNQLVKVWSNTQNRMIEKEWKDIGYSKKIDLMNSFLEESPQYVLIHRNPIAKVTGPVVRRLHKVVVQTDESGAVTATHGETFMMTQDDVDNVLDGDWDGDKGQIEFIDLDHADVMLGWQQSELFKEWNKTVHIDMFGPKAEQDPEMAKTSALSLTDSFYEIERNSTSDGAVGVMTNARNIMAQLFHKKLEARPTGANFIIRVTDPSAKTVMGYRPLDLDMLNRDGGDLINKIYENGDRIVSPDPVKGQMFLPVKRNEDGTISEKEGVLYLETTKAHEFSILFQMAVDGTKYHAWSDIVEESGLGNFNFMISQMFEKVNDDGSIGNMTDKDIRTAGGLYAVQNMSKHRGGRTATGLQAGYEVSIAQSQTLFQRMMDKVLPDKSLKKANVKGTLSDEVYSERYNSEHEANWKNLWTTEKFGYDGHPEIELNMENNLTPTEILLINIGDRLKQSKYYHVFHNREIRKTAHVMALQNMKDNPIIKGLHTAFANKQRLSDIDAVNRLINENIPISAFEGSKLQGIIEEYGNGKDAISMMDLWRALKDSTQDLDAVRSDMNDAFVDFTEYFVPMYDALSNEGKKLFTYKTLSGTKHDVYAMKFLPLRIQDLGVMKAYLKEWGKAMREPALNPQEMIRRNEIMKETKDIEKRNQLSLSNTLKVRKSKLINKDSKIVEAIPPSDIQKRAGQPGNYKAWLHEVFSREDVIDSRKNWCGK